MRFANSCMLVILTSTLAVSSLYSGEKVVWKPVKFAILRFNDDAPASWNMYEQEVYEVDPATVKPQGENVEWSPSDVPNQPVETSEWKVRDVGPVERVRFRFGKNGSYLDIQLPMLPNRKPAY